MFKVYISGRMGGRPVRDVLFERKLAQSFLKRNGLAYYDPAESEGLEKLAGNALIDLKASRAVMSSYVRKDERNLAKCDGVIVLSGDRTSDGTWWEMIQAILILRIPVVMVSPKRVRGELMTFSSIKVREITATIWEAASRLAELARARGYRTKAPMPKEVSLAVH